MNKKYVNCQINNAGVAKINIFYLDKDPLVSAKYHHDSHVVKMILEYAQLLSTAHRVLDGTEHVVVKNNRKRKVYTIHDRPLLDQVLYSATHINHPSAVWVRQSFQNYMYVYKMFSALLVEYKRRYGKEHKCTGLSLSLSFAPRGIPNKDFTQPPQAMPDEYKESDSVIAYRMYYNKAKQFRKNGKPNTYKVAKPNWLEWKDAS